MKKEDIIQYWEEKITLLDKQYKQIERRRHAATERTRHYYELREQESRLAAGIATGCLVIKQLKQLK